MEAAGLCTLGQRLSAQLTQASGLQAFRERWNDTLSLRSPEQAPQQGERAQVEVGPLPPPRLDDLVHMIGHHLDSLAGYSLERFLLERC
jgi:hypothetical protein